jgi:hypothetical protein
VHSLKIDHIEGQHVFSGFTLLILIQKLPCLKERRMIAQCQFQ